MKLYKHFNRLAYLRRVPRRLHSHLRWALTLKPGDIINDCSGFNVVIREIEPQIFFTKSGWYIYDVRFTTEPHGGSCSLFNCGVEPAFSVKEIEQQFRKFYNEWECGQGGWDFKTEKDQVWMRLSQGLSICDEQGIKTLDKTSKIS